MTANSCNIRCTSHESKTCIEFSIGRSDGASPGRCYLFSTPSTTNGDLDYDYYTVPTKVYPVITAPDTCTHKQAFSEEQDSAIRTTCSNISTESGCIADANCQWIPEYVQIAAKTSCSNQGSIAIGSFLAGKTAETCH
jgi:hypothetical protein